MSAAPPSETNPPGTDPSAPTSYDRIGAGYAQTRREDPNIRAPLHAALGRGDSVLNVGAGTGSYEPDDRHVIAIEPSAVMAAQRPAHRAPAIRALAHQLPLHDGSVDAAMAVLTLHHWGSEQRRGVAEMRRVSRGPVVILTIDARVSAEMWLIRDYLPEIATADRRDFPDPERIAGWLGPDATVTPLPLAAESPDWMLLTFWAHPERVLDPVARGGTSAFARLPSAVVDRAVAAVGRDLADGTWEERHGPLRERAVLDVGLRLITAPSPARPAV